MRHVQKSRITPADAGKTLNLPIRKTNAQDHPRGCGENCLFGVFAPRAFGSPPRMRGKRRRTKRMSIATRITPADAGKTVSRYIDSAMRQDHPRGCGENRSGTVRTKTTRGSPPRMRGKRGIIGLTTSFGRITPADAGKTWQCTAYSQGK